MQSSTKGLAKETDKLKKVADDAARKLKEVGNVQNWAEVMEREFLILEETVRLADRSDEEEDYGPCRVCGVRVEESGDELLWCRGCEGEFHVGCVGLEGVPGGEWWCAECEEQGTYLQSVKGLGVANEGAAPHAELDLKCHEVINGFGNGGDVEMGGMEDGKAGKGKERAVEEAVKGELSTTATGEGSSLDHSSSVEHPSSMDHSSSVDHSSALDNSSSVDHSSSMDHSLTLLGE